MAIMEEPKLEVSAKRLRLGVFLLLLWMLPFWMLGPYIADSGAAGNLTGAEVTTVIAVIQTIIGIAGAIVAGKEVTEVVKSTSKRQIPKTVWRVMVSGKVNVQE